MKPNNGSPTYLVRNPYGKSQGEGHLVLWTKQDKQSYFFAQNKFDEASKKAISLSQDMDVYYGIGLQREELTDGGRGREDTVISLPGLWLDIDTKGPNHVSEDLPPDRGSVKQLLDMFHLKPSLVVKTGGGFPYYAHSLPPDTLNCCPYHVPLRFFWEHNRM